MKILKKFRALLQIIRPELPAAAGLCVIIGQAIALGKIPSVAALLSGFFLGFCLSSSAMVFNDYFDLAVDRINAPYRPLPSGLLSQAEAAAYGAVFAVAALGIALCIHPVVFFLCLAAWVLGFLYNWKLKAAGLWGNLIVSSLVAMTFIIGGISVGQVANLLVWAFGAIAFFFDLGEEIAGDAMDMAGDQERDSRSIAIMHGKAAALRISGLLFGLVILLTLVPILLGEKSPGYFLPIAAMDLLIIFFTIRLLKSSTPRQGVRAMRGLYFSASLSLVAFLVGRFLG